MCVTSEVLVSKHIFLCCIKDGSSTGEMFYFVCLLVRHTGVLPTGVTHTHTHTHSLMYKHSRIMPEWFNSSIDLFCNIPNTPGVVFLNRDRREVLLLEIGV